MNCTKCNVSKKSNLLCDYCFFKMSLSELPFSDSYVDLRCTLPEGFNIGHTCINIRSLQNKVDHLRVFSTKMT